MHFHAKHYRRFVSRILGSIFLSGITYMQRDRPRKSIFMVLDVDRSIVFEELRSDLRRERSLSRVRYSAGIKLLSSG